MWFYRTCQTLSNYILKKEKNISKILYQNKPLTILPSLLAQIKARNNSNKLKYQFRHLLYLFYHHNKNTKKVYNNLINNDGSIHEKYSIKKHNELLAEHTIKNKVR